MRVIGIVGNSKSELLARAEHRGIAMQNLAFDYANSFCPRVFDDGLHQEPAEAAAFQIGANEDGIFAGIVVGPGMQAHDPSMSPVVSSMATKAMARA